jgi:hypothetical protein
MLLEFAPLSVEDAEMKPRIVAALGAAFLLLAVRARADEVEWRTAPGGLPRPSSAPAPAPEAPAVKPAEMSVSPPPVAPAQAQPPYVRFEDSEAIKRQPDSRRAPNDTPTNPPLPSYQPLVAPRLLPNTTSVQGMPQWKTPTNSDNTPTYDLKGVDALTCDPGSPDKKRQWYASAELLLWWISPMNAPPLLTTATPPNAGFIGGPTTQILIGNGAVNDPFEVGGRFSAGLWLDCCHEWSVDPSFFFLGPKSTVLSVNSQDDPVLIRPFFAINPQINAEFGEIVAFPPGFAAGGVPIPSSSGSFTSTATSLLLGAELNVTRHWWFYHDDGSSLMVDAFAGLRFLDLAESLNMQEQITVIANNPNPFDIPGTRVVVTDFFGTQNLFYGGQVGAGMEYRSGRLFVDLRGSIALGDTHQSLVINGSQVHTQPGGAVETFVGGLLALPGANIGAFSQDHFSFVPEARLNLGYQITDNIRAFVGYDFLYWYGVIRPGTEIDRVIDLTHAPNPPPGLTPVVPTRPMPLFSQQGFIAQGANIGVQFRW